MASSSIRAAPFRRMRFLPMFASCAVEQGLQARAISTLADAAAQGHQFQRIDAELQRIGGEAETGKRMLEQRNDGDTGSPGRSVASSSKPHQAAAAVAESGVPAGIVGLDAEAREFGRHAPGKIAVRRDQRRLALAHSSGPARAAAQWRSRLPPRARWPFRSARHRQRRRRGAWHDVSCQLAPAAGRLRRAQGRVSRICARNRDMLADASASGSTSLAGRRRIRFSRAEEAVLRMAAACRIDLCRSSSFRRDHHPFRHRSSSGRGPAARWCRSAASATAAISLAVAGMEPVEPAMMIGPGMLAGGDALGFGAQNGVAVPGGRGLLRVLPAAPASRCWRSSGIRASAATRAHGRRHRACQARPSPVPPSRSRR